jgi:endonuclease III
MISNQDLAFALKCDFDKYGLGIIENANKLESQEKWKSLDNYWEAILTNIIHIGQSANCLKKRASLPEYEEIKTLSKIKSLSKEKLNKKFEVVIPSSRTMGKILKIKNLNQIVDYFINNADDANELLNTDSAIKKLQSLPGIGSKAARNILMDLYHPSVRNNTIPIDINWKNFGKAIGEKWNESEKDESKIIEWRYSNLNNIHFPNDWVFDRFIYFILKVEDSETRKLFFS